MASNGGTDGHRFAEKRSVTASPVLRTARVANTIVVLHNTTTEGAANTMTLDLCIRRPGETSTKSEPLVKSMAREADEPAAKTLERLRLLFAPARAKGSAGKKTTREDILIACPAVRVLDGDPQTGVELDTGLPNCEFWRRARTVLVGDECITVKYNVPTITSIVPPSKPFVGIPQVCSNITVVFGDEEKLRYEWCLKLFDETSGEEGVTVLSTASTFVPTESMLGKRILLRVTPDIEAGLWTQVELPPVQAPPPPVDRWKETPSVLAFPAFRVVTYNILHDDFCTSKSCKARIYPFASDEVLDMENRQVRILQELLAYHADIVCMQECGRKMFHKFLLPAMRLSGYEGFYANKSGNVQEGCGFLFRRERFEMTASEVFPLNWNTLAEREPALAARVESHKELKDALTHLTTIGVVLQLREVNTGKPVVLGNTHLFYHANGCHIRILQMYLLLTRLKEVAATAAAAARNTDDSENPAESSTARVPVVLCGDFNCTHPTGAYRLATTGQIEDTHHSWEKGKLFWWGCDRQLGYSEQQLAELTGGDVLASSPDGNAAGSNSKSTRKDVPDAPTEEGTPATPTQKDAPREPLTDYFKETLHARMKLVDAYDRTDPGLAWTNFTLTFREVIDYIFFDDATVDVLRTIPIPPESELSENYALPNAKYPSDHVALVADLAFK